MSCRCREIRPVRWGSVGLKGPSSDGAVEVGDYLPTLPAFMHLAQTFKRVGLPSTTALTFWMLGFHLRLVLRCEWLILNPNPGFLPHISHTLDMITSSKHTDVC